MREHPRYQIGRFQKRIHYLTISNLTFNLLNLFVWSSGPWSHGSWIFNYLCNQFLSPLVLWVLLPLRARCITLCDKVCQWLATCQWFSPGTPISSTNKTDHHDIAEILLKVAINTIKRLALIWNFEFLKVVEDHNN
jgi:hypothetical protein